MPFKKLFLKLIILSLAGFISCSTAPEFERNNYNDPLSNKFRPDVPSSPEIYIDKNKHIHLSWEDETDFEDGYLIRKRLEKDSTIISIDTLNPNTTSYIDSTSELSLTTKYYIYPLTKRNTSLNGWNEFNLNFAIYRGFFVYPNPFTNNLDISWRAQVKDNRAYTDGFFIDSFSSDKSKGWLPFDTLKEVNASARGEMYFDIPDSLFNLKLRFRAYITDFNNEPRVFSTDSVENIFINEIKNLQLKIIDKNTAQLSWENSIPNAEGFLIDRKGYDNVDTVYNINNSYVVNFSPKSKRYLQYGVRPFINDNIGIRIESNRESL